MSTIESIPGWRDMSGAELVAFCNANPQTAKPIESAALQDFLRLNRLAWYSVDGKTVGLIPDLVRSGSLPPEVSLQIEGFLSKLGEKSQLIETDSDDYGGLLAGLMSLLNLSNQQIAKFHELGDGRKYPVFADAEEAIAAQSAAIAADELVAFRQRAVIAGIRFGERFEIGQDAGETMSEIWGELNGN